MQTNQLNNVQRLLTQHMDIWNSAETEKKTGRGRTSGSAGNVYGIKKLRELILELAVRGKLVPQDPNDEPASELLKRIQVEKAKLVAEGKLKKEKPLAQITADEKPFEVPKSWEWVRLQEVFDVRDGTHDTPKYIETGFPLVTSKNLYTGLLDFTDIKYISEQDHLSIKQRSGVERGDLLFAMIGSIGNPVVVETDIEFSIKNVALIKPYKSNVTNMNYLLNYLKKAAIDLREESTGAVQAFVSLGILRNKEFPLPPLPEQHRIVAKVDAFMALCDQLESQHHSAAEAHETLVSELLDTLTHGQDAAEFQINWQRIAEHFDVLFTTEASIDDLKQTLLQLAVMGKLVPQDPNDEPASELLKRIQVEKAKLVAEGKLKKEKPLAQITADEKPFEVPKSWEWVRFKTIATKITDGTHYTPKYLSAGIPFLSVKDMSSGKLNFSSTRFISETEHDDLFKRCNPEFGDLLLTKVGTTGIAVVVNINQPFSIFVSVALIKSMWNLINVNYLKLLISAPFVKKQSDEGTEGIGNKNLVLRKIEEFVLVLPPLTEQHRIVAKVDELMALCDKLKTRITEANQVQKMLADALVDRVI